MARIKYVCENKVLIWSGKSTVLILAQYWQVR